MTEYKFKTTINCGNCLSKVSPILDKEAGLSNWEVDLKHNDRILTVQTSMLTPDDIVQIVQKTGFKASLLD